MNVADQQTILSSGEMLGCYRIDSFLGQGGFGITYIAHDTMLDMQVAIKEYLPGGISKRVQSNAVEPLTGDDADIFSRGLSNFLKEARTLARFKHPNIVRVISVFELNGTAYMVMEYERGHDLKLLFSRREYVSEHELKSIFGPVLDGLQEVHRHGFIHRDIKPANILVRTGGTPVLLDFGSARMAIGQETQQMTAMVTSGFAPLEQYSGLDDQQGPWTDIYALGAVLYYAVTGAAPLDSALRGGALLNDKQDPLRPLSATGVKGYSASFCRAVDWAMQFKVSSRPQSLDQWRSRLFNDVDDQQENNEQPSAAGSSEPLTSYPTDEIIVPVSATRQIRGDENLQPTIVVKPSEQRPEYDTYLNLSDDSPTRVLPSGSAREKVDQLAHKTADTAAVTGTGEATVQSTSARVGKGTKATPHTGRRRRKADKATGSMGHQSHSTSRARDFSDRPWDLANFGSDKDRGKRRSVISRVKTGKYAPGLLVSAILAVGIALFWRTDEVQEPPARLPDRAPIAEVDKAENLQLDSSIEQSANSPELRVPDARALAELEAREAAVAQAEIRQAAATAQLNADRETQREEARRQVRLQLEREKKAEAERIRQAAVIERQARRQQQLAQAAEEAEAERLAERERNQFVTAQVDTTKPAITDQDMTQVLTQFFSLSTSIAQRDADALREITVESIRKNAYFDYVFRSFESVETRVTNISASRQDQTIRATLNVSRMIRSNGDIAIPPNEFKSIPIYAVKEDQWSAIHW